jgi:GNAT superfamily N-acetyltransferase
MSKLLPPPPLPLTIGALTPNDCPRIAQAFALQGWNKPEAQYQHYLQEAAAGIRAVLVAKIAADFAGYLTIVWDSHYPPFRQAGIPEIVDFNVLQKYQRQGIGTALMDAAEHRIAARSAIAGIGVGLMADYGAAQVLYIRRGYLPDGRGVFSHGRAIAYGDAIPVDDDLVLYLTKVLR